MDKRDTLQEINDRGFAVIPDVTSCETIATLIDELRELVLNSSRRAGLRDVLRVSPLSRTLANSDSIRSLIKPVLGEGAKCVRGLYFDKRREANWKVTWHQDLTIAVKQRLDLPGYGPWSQKAGILHVQPPAKVLERMLTLRLHLDDANETNGALFVLPGSHRFGKLNSMSIEDLKRKIAPEVCTVRKGGAMLMKPLLVHASSVVSVPNHRRVLHLEYAAGDLETGLEWDGE
jgi:hypothetical protein